MSSVPDLNKDRVKYHKAFRRSNNGDSSVALMLFVNISAKKCYKIAMLSDEGQRPMEELA